MLVFRDRKKFRAAPRASGGSLSALSPSSSSSLPNFWGGREFLAYSVWLGKFAMVFWRENFPSTGLGLGEGSFHLLPSFHLLGNAQIFHSLSLTRRPQCGNLGGLEICKQQAQKASEVVSRAALRRDLLLLGSFVVLKWEKDKPKLFFNGGQMGKLCQGH